MKRTKLILVSVMMMLLAITFSSCKKQTGKFSVSKVAMTYVKSPLNVPSIVEKELQSFEKAFKEIGLEFEYSNLDSGADQTAALASGDIQILNAVGGTSVLLSAANGADIKIIGMYSASPSAFRMFSKDDSINSPEDLRGKTIAGPKGTNLHELLVAYLKKGGMTIDDVNFVSTGIPNAFAGLVNGSVDCALVAGAVAYNCAASGYHLVTDGTGLTAGSILTATTQEFYNKNKEIIEKFEQVQEAAYIYIAENHNEAMKMAAAATELEISAVEEMYKMYDFRSYLTEDDLSQLQNTEKFMFDTGLIENHVNVKDLVLTR